MNKSKNTFFTIALILEAVHLLFALGATIFSCIDMYASFTVTTLISFFLTTMVPGVLLILGLAMKKKPLIYISFFLSAGFSLIGGIVSLFTAHYMNSFWIVSSLLNSLSSALVQVAFALICIGLFKLIEEPDASHPFAKITIKPRPANNLYAPSGQPPFGAPPQQMPPENNYYAEPQPPYGAPPQDNAYNPYADQQPYGQPPYGQQPPQYPY